MAKKPTEKQKNICYIFPKTLLIIVGFFALFTGAILSSKALQTIIY